MNRFLTLLDSDERAAGAMMTGDFTIVAGDAGARPSAGELRQLMREIGRDCRLDRLAPQERPSPATDPAIAVVVGHYHCVTREGAQGHDFAVDYVVQGYRIAGLYLHAGEAAISLPPSDRGGPQR